MVAVAPAAAQPTGRVETFLPTQGDVAVATFVPDVAPADSGGDCTLGRTTGSGALRVSAFFPNSKAIAMSVTLQFDSAGHLITYGEVRNPPHFAVPPGASAAVRDSVMRHAQDSIRTTTISLNYAVDQALAINRGGGKPTVAVIGTVRAAEHLQSLGDPAARMERVRTLCGV